MKVTEKYTKEEFEAIVAKWTALVAGLFLLGWIVLIVFVTPWMLIYVPVALMLIALVIGGFTFFVAWVSNCASDMMTCDGKRFLTEREAKERDEEKKKEQEENERIKELEKAAANARAAQDEKLRQEMWKSKLERGNDQSGKNIGSKMSAKDARTALSELRKAGY